MGEKNQAIKANITIQAPPAEVYTAITNATALTEWLCNVSQADPHPGGRLYLWWNNGYYTSGEYLKLQMNERVVFSWHGKEDPGPSRVKITLELQEEGTLVNLTHDRLGVGKEWNPTVREIKRGWLNGLENLKSVLETGVDLRIARLPMYGFTDLAEITPELIEQEQLDVQHGILIRGLVDGMGAQAAGLQAGDVLLKVAGAKVSSFGDLYQALRGHTAGDEIKIMYQRAGVREKTPLVLSARPLPQVPEDPALLAQELLKFNEAAHVDLVLSLKGMKEYEANFRPAETEWNIHENLAHLIASERDTHSWITSLIEGNESETPYHANEMTRIRAIASSFSNTAGFMKELKRLRSETVRMVAGLPPDFIARKRSYWRLAILFLQIPNLHNFEHSRQIRLLRDKAHISLSTPGPETTARVEQEAAPGLQVPIPEPDGADPLQPE